MTQDQIKEAILGAIWGADNVQEAAAAVMALVGPKPLVWMRRSDTDSHVCASGQYWIGESKMGWIVTGYSYFVGKTYSSPEAAQAAAQSHADAAHWGNTNLSEVLKEPT